uniref:F-box/FBD/LRR-repeat protein At1g13570-like n=1 Tax=Erigeron canadensis TaxID=72917 RepID=UPI001CB8BBDB|nr:F-box/FBD/LRR-repeat protein At1g13570-like [Erigeron canadensis]
MDENQLSILDQTIGVASQRKHLTKMFKFFHAIYQVMLLHQGPIYEFTLTMDMDNTCFEIDHIIVYLSRSNTLKKCHLSFGPPIKYRLPLSFFSLHKLTDLYIKWCCLDHQPTFCGFGRLTSLYMMNVDISTKSLLHLVSSCPLLNKLGLECNIISNERSTINELFLVLPLIEDLSTWHWIAQCFSQDGVPKVIPTTLVHLKYFSLFDMCFSDENKLSIFGHVIRSSPNLEKLSVMMLHYPFPENFVTDSITLEDYSDIWLERLNEFEIVDFINLELEMEFVKLILAKSPVLKKVRITLDDEVTKEEEMFILRILLRCPNVSPVVEIIVERFPMGKTEYQSNKDTLRWKLNVLAKDRISTLPQNIIETILCDLHIRDAVRTSVLSKNWRYSWTRIPKLVFVEDTFDKITGKDQLSVMEQELQLEGLGKWRLETCKFLYTIYQVLLLHQGPILQLTLDMHASEYVLEIDQIILHLSRKNTVTELKLQFDSNGDLYILPLSIYSLHQLTNLHLDGCKILHPLTFSGFGSLTTLYLDDVRIRAKTLLHLLSKSPLLKRVTLLYDLYDNDYVPVPFIELFECLPLIEHLTTSVALFDLCLNKDAAPQKLPTSLVHLRYMCLEDIRIPGHNGLSCLALLIKPSPNLEKINLRNPQMYRGEQYIDGNPITLEDYSDIWLEHLYELNIIYFANLKTELEFLKLILVKSPVLKKARIVLDKEVTKDEENQLLRNLLRAPRVSPIVEIIVERR